MSAVQTALATLIAQGTKLMGSNAQFLQDVDALTAAVKTNTATLATIKSLVEADNASIASLTDQVAQLKKGNPDLDLSGLEADIAALQANNVTAQSIAVPAPIAPAPASA